MHSRIRPLYCLAVIAAIASGGCVSPSPDEAEPESAALPTASRTVETPPRETTPPGRVTRIDLVDFFALHQSGNVLLYDVRPAFFHSLGSIPGSVSWPKSAFNRQVVAREAEIREASAAGKPVVLYCTDAACPDARAVATWLAERGHDTTVLDGGWEAWKAVGLPDS